jgi:hypothetical protein
LRGEHVIPFVSTSPEMASVDRPARDQLMDHLHARCLASDSLPKAVEWNAERTLLNAAIPTPSTRSSLALLPAERTSRHSLSMSIGGAFQS